MPSHHVSAFKNAVVLISDAAFLPAAYFVAHQALQQPDRNYDVVILAIGAEAQASTPPDARILIRKFDTNARLSKIEAAGGGRVVVNARLCLSSLGDDYKRILYVDCDIFLATTQLHALFDLDMGPYAIGAVRDGGEILRRETSVWQDYKRSLGLASVAPYLNAGVLLIDLQKFDRHSIGERALRYIEDGGELGGLYDQSALNAVLKGDWLELSPLWNWQFASRGALTRSFAPHIVHFIGGSKPWNDRRGRYPDRYRQEMVEYLSTIGHREFMQAPARLKRIRRDLTDALRLYTIGDERHAAIRRFATSAGFADPGLPSVFGERQDRAAPGESGRRRAVG
jgi:Glycosyl transferase family 8